MHPESEWNYSIIVLKSYHYASISQDETFGKRLSILSKFMTFNGTGKIRRIFAACKYAAACMKENKITCT